MVHCVYLALIPDERFSRFDTLATCDGHTDGQTPRYSIHV